MNRDNGNRDNVIRVLKLVLFSANTHEAANFYFVPGCQYYLDCRVAK